MPAPEEVRIYRLKPTVISILDDSKGFGHTDLVTCEDEQRHRAGDGVSDRTVRY